MKNVKDLWGQGWSLRSEQDPRTMEYLGTITHQGVNYKYYKNTEGEILYDSEPEQGKPEWIDNYVHQKEVELRGETGNVHFAAFRVVAGRLKMYSDPTVDKVCFRRVGSRLKYRLKM